MSLVLAFDTATEHTALALGRFEHGTVQVLGVRDFHARRAALSRLLPAIRELLSETGTERVSISTVVVGRGPGSFTGVRIGVATAKGLAQALGAQLRGVGTLDAVAWRFARSERLVGVVGDAMRGEVYPALFGCGAGSCERLTADRVTSPEDAARSWAELLAGQREAVRRGFGPLPEHPLLLAGDALAKHAAVFAEELGAGAEIAPEEMWTPGGEMLLHAAHASLAAGEQPGDAASLLPIYTRLSDAEETERLRSSACWGYEVPETGVAGPGDHRGDTEPPAREGVPE